MTWTQWGMAAVILASMGSAAAQVGKPLDNLLKAPVMAGAQRNAAGILTLPGGATVVVQERGGFVLGAKIIVLAERVKPAALSVTGGTPAASATGQTQSGQAQGGQTQGGQAQAPAEPDSAALSGAGIQRAADLLAVLTGMGDSIAAPFVEFLNQPNVLRDLPGGVNVNAGAFQLKISATDKLLTVDVAPNRVPDAQFAQASHLLPARQESANPVVLRLYSDFQCPYCKQFEQQTLPALLGALPDDVQIEFHQLPLESIHPLARPAAEASECAAQQGKFWEYKDALFADTAWQQGNPNLGFIALAQKTGLGLETFKNCLAERGGMSAVDDGLKAASRLGLTGTPTVFVNGYRAPSAYDVNALLELIQFARVADRPLP